MVRAADIVQQESTVVPENAVQGNGVTKRLPVALASVSVVLDELVVTSSKQDLIGIAATSSQGVVTKQELDLRPVYRVGQLLETVHGLTVTTHSGEGKANQYLLRGFNLDHGTDLATFIDEMPVNMRTHAHGQGYTDLNFFIPELASQVDFTKGPYYASEGDFASVGSVHVGYLDRIVNQMSISTGTVGDQRLFAGGTTDFGPGQLLSAVELVHLDGPWDHPDNMLKFNAVLRYSEGTATDGLAVTGMAYRGQWNATTDQPTRAVAQGLIGRYGTLGPSDGGQAERFSLSGRYAKSWGDWQFKANTYAIKSKLTLWNDFTHYLDDSVNGDQHAQNESRAVLGGGASLTHFDQWFAIDSITTFGAQARYDDNNLDLKHTVRRAVLSTNRDNHIKEGSIGIYTENTTYWTSWFRSILGAREDYFHASDDDLVKPVNSGSESQALFQPKASLVFGPFAKTEFYISAGNGFHSNDVRSGITDAGTYTRAPLLVKSKGSEVGIRSTLIPNLQLAVTLFKIDFASELIYNAETGTTGAGRPSHRTGFEITGQYHPFYWLELNADLSRAHARYTDNDPAGNYIEDAPDFIASVGALIDNLGPWSAGVVFRDLGPHPLTTDNTVRAKDNSEWNADIGYKISPRLKVWCDIFNLFNAKGNAAEYYYTSRLQSEPVAGVAGIQAHPLEPRSARITLTMSF